MNHYNTSAVKALVLQSAVDDHGYSVIDDLTKVYQLSDIKQGASVDNWKRKIALHEDASSAYERWICKLTFTSGRSHARFHYGPSNDITHGQWLEHGPISGISDFFSPTGQPEAGWGALSTSARNRLNVKFLNELKSTRTTWNSGEFLGEIAETLHGIRHPAMALRKGLSAYLFAVKKRCSGLKGRYALSERTRALNKIISGTWLEYQYQWRSLKRDIKDAGQAYNDLFDDAAGLHPMTKVMAKVDDSVVDTGWGQQYFRPGNFWHVWTDTNPFRTVTGRMIGFLDTQVNQPVRFDQRIGLSPADWIPTCWNLLPMSFVADYFVNIGDCLTAAGTSTSGLKVLCLTTRTKRRYEASAVMDKARTLQALIGAGVQTDSLDGSPSKMVYDTSYWVREVLDPSADLWVVPTVQLPSLGIKWVNLAALTAQVLATKLSFGPIS
jgi:hypothetical protein